MSEDFEVIGRIEQIQLIARGNRIREIDRLRKAFGAGSWRNLPPHAGCPRGDPGHLPPAVVRFGDGTIHRVELHWYEAHGIGRKKLKIKDYLD